jgi:hypothetical protein
MTLSRAVRHFACGSTRFGEMDAKPIKASFYAIAGSGMKSVAVRNIKRADARCLRPSYALTPTRATCLREWVRRSSN